MPKRKPSPDDNTAIVDAVNRITGSEPVRGEDLLPPELRKQFLDTKEAAQRKARSSRKRVAP